MRVCTHIIVFGIAAIDLRINYMEPNMYTIEFENTFGCLKMLCLSIHALHTTNGSHIQRNT